MSPACTPAMTAMRQTSSAHVSRSPRVNPATTGLPVVPDEEWISTTSSMRRREQAEGVLFAEVALGREREPANVVEAAHVAGLDPQRRQLVAVEGDALVDAGHRGLQPLELQRAELLAVHRLVLRVPDRHGGSLSSSERLAGRAVVCLAAA